MICFDQKIIFFDRIKQIFDQKTKMVKKALREAARWSERSERSCHDANSEP